LISFSFFTKIKLNSLLNWFLGKISFSPHLFVDWKMFLQKFHFFYFKLIFFLCFRLF
jgi:hypothetical protein